MHWQVRKGGQRKVLALPKLDVVIKVPRWKPRVIKNYFWGDVVGMWNEMYASPHPDARKLYWECVWLGLARCLKQCYFGGIADNWREWRYYRRSNFRPLLQPTYVSIFGFINIQRRGIPAEDIAVHYACMLIIKSDAAYDSHHWDHPYNFDVSSGRLKILDYGNMATQKIIEKHGEKLLTCFDLKAGEALKDKSRELYDDPS